MTYPYGQTQLPRTFRCVNHPDREGVGVCVSCRSVVCVECSTKVDRMNYCIRCLQAATEPARAAAVDNPRREVMAGVPLLALAFIATVVTFGLLGLLLALFRHGAGGGVSG